MGGTGSVMQRERRKCTRSEEMSLLRLYNRQARNGLSEQLLLKGYVEQSKKGPPCDSDGKDEELPAKATTKKTDSWPQQLLADLLQHNKSSGGDDGRRQGTKMASRAGTPTINSSPGSTLHLEEKNQPPTRLVYRRRTERARARENVLLQMYNRSHADLDSSLRSLTCLLQRCSTENTGWAPVTAVSDALMGVGVAVSEATVLLLANQSESNNLRFQYRDQGLQHEDIAVGGKCRLVYWLSMAKFLEEGPSARRGCGASNFRHSRKCPGPSRIMDHGHARGEDKERGDSTAETCKLDDTPPFPKVNTLATRILPESGPEATPEPDTKSCIGFEFNDNDEGDGGRAASGCRKRVELGVLDIEAGLQAATLLGQLSPRHVADTMDEIRLALKNVGMRYEERREGEGDVTPGTGAPRSRDQQVRQPLRNNVRLQTTLDEVNVDEAVGGGSSLLSQDPPDVEGMASAACAAGKRGDVTTLEYLARSMDLSKNDAFGRNALYYACLCGQIEAARFVVDRAYGSVQEIPEKERWECRKNALTDQMRHYLDTGRLPLHPNDKQALRGELMGQPPAPENENVVRDNAEEGGCGDDRRRGGEQMAATDTDHARQPEEALPITSLFGWGSDGGNGEDY